MTDSLKERLQSCGDYDLERLPPDLRPGPDDKPPFHIMHEALARIEQLEGSVEHYRGHVRMTGDKLQDAYATIAKLEGENRELFENNGWCASQIATLQGKLDRAIEGLRSIAANSCCDKCQEAALVASSILSDLRPKDQSHE